MDCPSRPKKPELTLTITEDEKWAFFAEYDKLGDRQKDVWRKLVAYAKKYPDAHPSQARIAKEVGCTREHANRSISKFKKIGWIYLQSRGHKKAKSIVIPLYLLAIDLVERQYFRKVEITSEITHNYSKEKHTSTGAGKLSEKPLDLPIWLTKATMSHDSKLKLSLLPEYIYQEAVHKWKNKVGTGFKPENPEKYFVGTAFKIAEKKGFKPIWRDYYQRRNN